MGKRVRGESDSLPPFPFLDHLRNHLLQPAPLQGSRLSDTSSFHPLVPGLKTGLANLLK